MSHAAVSMIDSNDIQNRIFTIRGLQVMVDRDLADLYGVETKRLNELVANCDRFESFKHSTALPYGFTEQGVSMLSAVLHSETAIQVSIQIIDAFVGMRKFIANNASILGRLDTIEQKQRITDARLDQVFGAIEAREVKPAQGIFFDGQIFDSYVFANVFLLRCQRGLGCQG